MTINEELTAFRSQFPGCSVMTFADASTGMVLGASAAVRTTQETLDALCLEGRDALSGQLAQAVSAHFATSAQSLIGVAMHADAGGIKCFVRAPLPAPEMLCFVAGENTAFDDLLNAAKGLLTRLVSEG
ncbi:hypothetical protein [Roseobacter sp. OBYS 0001]|uniref:hypothetical protein n=1 Tax=Roseobacter sp. OBYS 0001 TaxID=882651 RepID=UPI001BC2C6B3|nr:hypothetical protein [Roseobacter sp. OBYS 0001]GIT85525.1 hypothetical protein ROBYS_05410 [Roseobacter sp. OBYS 0001]